MSYPIKHIIFKNASPLTIIIESFVDDSISSKCVRVGPEETVLVTSCVGEWHLHSMLEQEDRKLWDTLDNGRYKNITTIGKFRSNPCASGNYSWIDYDAIFDCLYSENSENIIKGVITFSLFNLSKTLSRKR
jgi:hypothetical protein